MWCGFKVKLVGNELKLNIVQGNDCYLDTIRKQFWLNRRCPKKRAENILTLLRYKFNYTYRGNINSIARFNNYDKYIVKDNKCDK